MPIKSASPSLGTILLLGALTAYAALTLDLYLPAMPTIGDEFDASSAVVQKTMSAFLIGMALGQLIYGPLSDRLGRRPLLLFGSGLYVLASLGCAFAPSIEWLIAARLVQALGACAGVVIARAVVRDRFEQQDSARIFSMLVLVLGVAPLLAPTAGGWLVLWMGWRSIFAVLAVFGLTLGFAVWRALPESRSSATAILAHGEGIMRSYITLLRQRRFLGFLLVGSFNAAALFAYVSSSADLLMVQMGFSVEAFGYLFATMAVAIIGASQVNRKLLQTHDLHIILVCANLFGLLAALVLLAIAKTGFGGAPMVLAGLFIVLGSYGLVTANAMAAALAVDPHRAGTASALMGAGAFGAGALASLWISYLHDGTAVPIAGVIAITMLASTAALFGIARRTA
jgi:DHA1 family bicyclomycin/chloramphenicol resistance-like MFS transporter